MTSSGRNVVHFGFPGGGGQVNEVDPLRLLPRALGTSYEGTQRTASIDISEETVPSCLSVAQNKARPGREVDCGGNADREMIDEILRRSQAVRDRVSWRQVSSVISVRPILNVRVHWRRMEFVLDKRWGLRQAILKQVTLQRPRTATQTGGAGHAGQIKVHHTAS